MEGTAINSKMTAGAIVQMVSIICPSKGNRPFFYFVKSLLLL